jgi:hypothetical protein
LSLSSVFLVSKRCFQMQPAALQGVQESREKLVGWYEEQFAEAAGVKLVPTK